MIGHIRPRGKRTWAVVLDIGVDEAGKRKQKWHTVHGTKKRAQAELARLLHQLNTGAYVPPSDLTVSGFIDRWLKDYARTAVMPKTYERYESIATNHIKPMLGAIPLAKLQPLHIQGAYTKWLESGRVNKRRTDPAGLSERTVLQHHRVLHKALQMAVRWQLLGRNPADAVEPPAIRKKEMRVLDETQTAWLLDAAVSSPLRVPILAAVSTGLRRGELLALRWSDINLTAAVMHINRSVEQTKDRLVFKEPKGKKGRKVDLPQILVEALSEHRKEQDIIRSLFAGGYEENDLVFPREDGSIWPPDNFTSLFVGLAARVGLKGIRLHDLRHSHASQLLRQGVHPKVVQERLGHSTVAVTMDVYSHLLPGLQQEAAHKIGETLRQAIEKRKEARVQ